MNLLFSIDDNFVDQMLTTLYSISCHHQEKMSVYILQKEALKETDKITDFINKLGYDYQPIIIGQTGFSDAPTTDRYPETIYYRLLAHEFLPEDLDRILYLDADILCINDFSNLYKLDLGLNLYAAASHTKVGNLLNKFNQKRLGLAEVTEYFNSGVLLMNLKQIRQQVRREDIFAFIEDNYRTLFLPDQDVLNGLYGPEIISLPDEVYNYDTRYGFIYESLSRGEWNSDWVMVHTVFLHFCGRNKPWIPKVADGLALLYKHYQAQAQKILEK
ncbi:glycosyltransferase family 8 protein [Ignavigranum ruoffiae]|uniref:Lipopolysaccharide biosynthesis protein, LPS:glycosyltransferase n=1 Tax=Ignavigranum ruoffiae TaxID=89093 RepID=A0A1H9EL34_9LACT|nr:glycosyltransferase family 8 protein [Ignavigranum ruoffiae]SEQ26369.1 Lipopolysaccharide biosynthesis protein, LPS:glycosyltransferase [Ignavigranum ruoffiae]